MYLCLCHGISEKDVEKLLKERRIASLKQLRQICKAGSSCGSCLYVIKDLIESTSGKSNDSLHRQGSKCGVKDSKY